jgi:hypothetical protein
MQSPKTPSHTHGSPIKQHIMQQHQQQRHADNNSSSSDQLSGLEARAPAYGMCPLIPCMPDLNRYAEMTTWPAGRPPFHTTYAVTAKKSPRQLGGLTRMLNKLCGQHTLRCVLPALMQGCWYVSATATTCW